ncbi:MAG TPA: galactokinase family protein [Gemmatimonadales bacterium]|jgi:galactokinase
MKPAERARELFRRHFGTDPVAVASAPGRVNLVGEHVDNFGGHVLPMATGWRTAVAVGPGHAAFRAISEQQGPIQADWPAAPQGHWSDYVAGVASLDSPLTSPWSEGLCAAVASDVPTGAGLSSSAALEVATGFALSAWAGRSIDPAARADLAWRTETGFVGMPCGRMDQIASARATPGEAMLLDCRTLGIESVPVRLDVVIAESGESHALRDSSYADRRRDCDNALAIIRGQLPGIEYLTDIPPARLNEVAGRLPAPLDRRVKHVVNENQRTLLAAQALAAGDVRAFGLLVGQSHNSLRDNYECSTPRLDAIVSAARAVAGVRGARLVGAGWGGSVLVVCDSGAGADVAARLRADATLALPLVSVVEAGGGAALETD